MSNNVEPIRAQLMSRIFTPEEAARIRETLELRVQHEPASYWPGTALMPDGEPQGSALFALMHERRRQDLELFPEQRPGTQAFEERLIQVIIEESLELMQQADSGTTERMREEAVHLGAVAVKILEHIFICTKRADQGKHPTMNRIDAEMVRTGQGEAYDSDRGRMGRHSPQADELVGNNRTPGVFEQ